MRTPYLLTTAALCTSLFILVPTACGPGQNGLDGGLDASTDGSIDGGGETPGPLAVGNLGPHAVVVGENANIQLQVDGGTPPYQWEQLDTPEPLTWATLEAGVITGTPLTDHDEQVMQIRVSESGGEELEAEVRILAVLCTSGMTRPCGVPDGENGVCYSGTATCSGGVWGSCVGEAAPSTDENFCDGDCSACDSASVSDCVGGKCVCGSAGTGPCADGESCCVTSGSEHGCTDLDTDPSNCGACQNSCTVYANADPTCADGACGSTCEAGWARCGEPENSVGDCLTHLVDNELHCGSCGNTCNVGDPASGNREETGTCAGTSCALQCAGTFEDCDGSSTTCETDLASDPDNCGACAHVCGTEALPAGSEEVGHDTCSDSQCGWDCEPEGQTCGGKCFTLTNQNHCGGCNQPCRADLPHVATAQCVDSGSIQCNLTCDPGWEDCNGDPSDGCEADLASDTTCGTCGNSCGSFGYCSSGECCETCGDGLTECCGDQSCRFVPATENWTCTNALP